MKLAGKYTEYNKHLTDTQSNYWETRIESLYNILFRKYGDNLSFNESRQSEAVYISIEGTDFGEISIRNHTNNYSNAKKIFWFDDYMLYKDLKKDLMNYLDNVKTAR